MTQVYELPVPHYDFRRTEVFHQLIDSLENLETVVDNVFGKISERVKKERERVDALNVRVSNAQAKVKHLSLQTSKATKVQSPAKYPEHELQFYQPLYSELLFTKAKHSKPLPADLMEPLPTANSRDIFADLQLLNDLQLENRTHTVQQEEGLGKLPENLHSLTSLLLFNTDDNPYRMYISLDNLAGSDEVAAPSVATEEIAPAPLYEPLKHQKVQDLNYRPELDENFPQFNLPDTLDLPMVADLTYSADLQSIAPSLPLPGDLGGGGGSTTFTSVDIPADLPLPLADAGAAPPPPPPPPPAGGAAPLPPPPPPPKAAPGPPPPPPQSTPVAQPPTGPSSGPPPPPPPPPPPKEVPKEIAAPSGARSDLLESIRQGKSLKSVKSRNLKDRPLQPKKKGAKAKAKTDTGETPADGGEAAAEEEDKAPPSAQGIFGDLLAALDKRRKSMNNQKQAKKKEGDDEDW